MKKVSLVVLFAMLATMLLSSMPVIGAQPAYYFNDMSSYSGNFPTIFDQVFPNFKEETYWNMTAYNDLQYGTGLQFGSSAVIEKTFEEPIKEGKVLIGVTVKALEHTAYTNAGIFLVLMSDYELDSQSNPIKISQSARNTLPQAGRLRVAESDVTVAVKATGGTTSSDGNINKSVTPDAWHRLETLVDFGTGKQTFYVDGEIVVESEIADVIKQNGIKSVLLSGSGLRSASENQGVVADDFMICSTQQNTLSVVSLTHNEENKTMTIQFDGVLDNALLNDNDAMLTTTTGESVQGTVEKTDINKITITYNGKIDKGKRYKITFGSSIQDVFGNLLAEELVFTQITTELIMSDFKIIDSDGNIITDASIFDNTVDDSTFSVCGELYGISVEEKAAVIIATYADKAAMRLTFIDTVDIANVNHEYEMTIPKDTDVKLIKMFVWKGLSHPMPLAEVYTIPSN